MTLADVLKPSVQLVIHAETKGSQVGAALGLAVALPGVALLPNRLNSADAPPLVAIARVCGVSATAGAAVATALCITRLVRLSNEEIKQRAHKLTASDAHRAHMTVCATGTSIGLALMAVRIAKLAHVRDEPMWKTIISKECLWDCYCFGVMGSAVAAALYKASQFASNNIWCDKNVCTDGNDNSTTAEMQQVAESVDAAVNQMSQPDDNE